MHAPHMDCQLLWQPLCEYVFWHCDLDLWPSDLKVNRGHLRVIIYVPMKFHDPRHKFLSYHPETILLFWVTVTLTFDLVTSKSIGVICESWSMYLWSFMILGKIVLGLSSGNHLVDRHMDIRTDMCKTINLLFFGGGHKYLTDVFNKN